MMTPSDAPDPRECLRKSRPYTRGLSRREGLPSAAPRQIGARVSARIIAVYRVKSDAASIEARARGIALEQSIEAPLEAVRDPYVAREIVGEPGAIREAAAGVFEVEIGLGAATVGDDAGQLLNMLYGNSSLQDDVELIDFRLPEGLLSRFPGPGQGIEGLRARA